MRIAEIMMDKFSIEFLKNQVLKNAYGNDDTFIAKTDPRVLLVWYAFFGVVPWFMDNLFFLFSMLFFVVLTTHIAKVAPLVLFLFSLGVFTQTGYLLIISLFFGSDVSIIVPLLILTLKVTVVSLASVTVFSGMDPDSLADGLLFFKFPDLLAFSISFGYRILPLIMEEFQGILLSHRLRGIAPEGKGLVGSIKVVAYQIKIIMLSFYPLMLNMAKKSRTTVEALEIKGYHHALKNPDVKKLKQARLKIKTSDVLFSLVSIVYVSISTILAITYF